MLETVVIILAITALAFIVQERTGLASPITILGGALTYSFLGGQNLMPIDNDTFDEILLSLLPLLIMTDALHLKLQELKENAASIFYAAVISVVLAVVSGVLISKYVLPYDDIPTYYLVMLFCMVIATDPVAVCSVFSGAKLPHKLKFTAETESLFNDCSAVVIFGIAAMYAKADMAGTTVTTTDLVSHSLMAVGGAAAVGLVCGIAGLWLLSLSRAVVVEASILLMAVYASFYISELFHWAGILAVVVSTLVANTIIKKRISEDKSIIESERKALEGEGVSGLVKHFFKISTAIEDEANHKSITNFIQLFAMLATTVLFLSMAAMVSFDSLMTYWKPIMAVFVATTLIRGIMMMKFALLSNAASFMQNINLRWWAILSFAGVKGGLSILLLHMMPGEVKYMDMFSAIVIGNILLTTFIYPPIMLAIIKLNSAKFEEEAEAEKLIA
ncbi:cation:proton antiporter [Neptuniibacter sp. QD37_11]|uniref:cation:proton antiporter domain-containing protein n=1 Tax=Neptuniibacter sp. QD37_11 TaxID=3398209 RepID=UPI0039F45C1A